MQKDVYLKLFVGDFDYTENIDETPIYFNMQHNEPLKSCLRQLKWESNLLEQVALTSSRIEFYSTSWYHGVVLM